MDIQLSLICIHDIVLVIRPELQPVIQIFLDIEGVLLVIICCLL